VADAIDTYILNQWHVLAALEETVSGLVHRTTLLDRPIGYSRAADGAPMAWLAGTEPAGASIPVERLGAVLPTIAAYGYLWTCLGTPQGALFPVPEYAEPDRKNLSAGSIGVNVSAPRVVENFLDMGHFPYVHTDILGAEPHTEVKEYDVEVTEGGDEILATRCRFYQPKAALSATHALEVEYIYRVPHPYCSVLYKSCPADTSRMDVIAVFVQPMGHERVRAHLMISMIDEEATITTLRRFQQTIFGQDKPILENQYPKRLPLDPRAETPIRADKSAIVYRRWLSQKGITYGVIPHAV